MRLILVLLFLLSLSTVQAASIDDLLLLDPVDLSIGTLYVGIPESSSSNDLELSAALFVDEVNADVTVELRRNGNLLNADVESGDTEDGETYSLLTWFDVVDTDAEYNLIVNSDGEEIYSSTYQTEFIISVISNDSTILSALNFEGDRSLDELRNLIVIDGVKISKRQFNRYQQNAQELFALDKNIVQTSTIFNNGEDMLFRETIIEVNPLTADLGEAWSLYVIEEIPKSVAEDVSLLDFVIEPTVLEADPVVMWHIEDTNEASQLTYVAESSNLATGNTILLAVEGEVKRDVFNPQIILPLVAIPLIAGILIYFSKFKNAKKKD